MGKGLAEVACRSIDLRRKIMEVDIIVVGRGQIKPLEQHVEVGPCCRYIVPGPIDLGLNPFQKCGKFKVLRAFGSKALRHQFLGGRNVPGAELRVGHVGDHAGDQIVAIHRPCDIQRLPILHEGLVIALQFDQRVALVVARGHANRRIVEQFCRIGIVLEHPLEIAGFEIERADVLQHFGLRAAFTFDFENPECALVVPQRRHDIALGARDVADGGEQIAIELGPGVNLLDKAQRIRRHAASLIGLARAIERFRFKPVRLRLRKLALVLVGDTCGRRVRLLRKPQCPRRIGQHRRTRFANQVLELRLRSPVTTAAAITGAAHAKSHTRISRWGVRRTRENREGTDSQMPKRTSHRVKASLSHC